jgi:hypothetical protein
MTSADGKASGTLTLTDLGSLLSQSGLKAGS